MKMRMSPGDVVLVGKSAFRITGVYLGGTGTQDIVGLESLWKTAGYADGKQVKEMFVPMEMVLEVGFYRHQ